MGWLGADRLLGVAVAWSARSRVALVAALGVSLAMVLPVELAAGIDAGARSPTALAAGQLLNRAPVARPRLRDSFGLGSQVRLDASQSTDADGNRLSYRWEIVDAPAGSAAALSARNGLASGFFVDLPGAYVVRLTVNDGVIDSASVAITLSTANTPPVANAGPDQTLPVGSVVLLEGAGSRDPDDGNLTYQWQFDAQPDAGTTVLREAETPRPSFQIAEPGEYALSLTVTDAMGAVSRDYLTVSTNNSRPIARVRVDGPALVGEPVALSAADSSDIDQQALNFRWDLLYAPPGSAASLTHASATTPTFMPDMAGQYVLQLIANDGLADSYPVTVLVNAAERAHGGDDMDGDGISDPLDNCLAVANPAQTDTDGDGFGNACDADLNNDGSVDLADLAELKDLFFTSNELADFNGDGVVDFLDLAAFKAAVFSAPGPSGLFLPPSITPVDDQIAPVGSMLSFTLQASDPNNDELVFSVTPFPLPPNALLDAATGQFTFSPSVEELGIYDLTFAVSDGTSVVSEFVRVTVPDVDPGAPASIVGQLLDANDYASGTTSPVVGATVSFIGTGLSAVSAADGTFSIDNLPDDELVIDIDSTNAAPAPDGSSYAGFREVITLEPNVVNVIDRPFFLPRIDDTSVVTVDPNTTTMLENEDLGIMMMVPPNTAKNPDGTDFDGDLSISSVPRGFAPMELPEGLDPALLITVQPVGVTFSTPVPVMFENIESFPPDNEVDLWSLDAASGEFKIVGVGEVSVDGQMLETISGGISAASWHAFMPPSGDPDDMGDEDNCPCDKSSAPVSSEIETRSGWLSTDFSVPLPRALGEERPLKFVYRSERAKPYPVIPFELTVPQRGAVPNSVSYRVTIGGVEQSIETFISTAGLSESLDEVLQVAPAFDGSELPTGLHAYEITTSSNYSSSKVSASSGGRLTVVNSRDSAYGAGWGIAGVNRLYTTFNDGAIVVDGGGSAVRYDPAPISLFDWTAQGNLGISTWQIAADGNSVVQTQNGDPSFFVGTQDLIDVTLRGRMRVLTSSDDDFIGLVMGYRGPFSNDDNALEAILFDWKQGDQTFSGRFAAAGPALTRVTGQDITDFLDTYWGHTSNSNFDVLANDFGSSNGWLDNTFYDFEVQYGADRIVVLIDDQVVFDVEGEFPSGRFGFYNYSQPDVEYELFTSAGGFTSSPGDFSQLSRSESNGFVRTLKDGTRINFDAQGLQTSVVDRNNNTTSFGYDVDQNLTSITDPVGGVTQLNYISGRLTTMTDAAGRLTQFLYSVNNDLTQVILPDGTSRRFAYDGDHLMTSETDGRGNRTQRSFDFTGRHLNSIMADDSVRSTSSIHQSALVDRATGVGTITDPAPLVRPAQARATVTDGNGNTETTNTDRFGRTTSVVDALTRTTAFERNEIGQMTRITRPNASTVAFTYDDLGNVLSINEESIGAITAFAYDPLFNQVISITDPDGHATNITLDTQGNPQAITDALGRMVTVIYNPNGLPASVTDQRGNTTSFTYDPQGNLMQVTDALLNTRTFAYNPAGDLTSWTDENGHVTTVTYDAMSRVLSTTNPEGAVNSFDYDAEGNVVAVTNATGEVTAFTYDQLNRISTIDNPITGLTAFTYDLAGNAIQTLLSNGNLMVMTYDAVNQLRTVSHSTGAVEAFEYDVLGNATEVTDPNGNISQFVYDPIGRLMSRQDPLLKTETFGYDLRSNITSYTSKRGSVMSFVYDELGRVITQSTPDNLISYSYDEAGNLTGVDDSDSSVTFAWDVLNRLSSTSTTGTQPDTTLSFAYDLAGNRTMLSTSDGQALSYGYDDADNISSLTPFAGAPIIFTTDGVGRQLSIDFPNAVQSDLGYNNRGLPDALLLRSGATTIRNQAYTYDAIGNIDSLSDALADLSYQYDETEQLSAVLASGMAIETYQYDLAGNRQVSHLSASHSHDAVNRLLSDANATYSYDDAGNLGTRNETASGDITSYTYDAQEQLIQIDRADGTVVSYRYDGLGRRIEKDIDGTVSRFVYDNQDLLAEYDAADAVLARYSHGPLVDQPLQMQRGGAVHYLHADRLGSITQLSDDAGAVVSSYAYDAFGQTATATETVISPFGYTGRERDTESQLIYYRARYYDPLSGRFTTQDPIGFAGFDQNLYRYVGNNPMNRTDPSGNFAPLIAACVRGGLVGAATGAAAAAAAEALTGGCDKDVGRAALIGGITGGVVGCLTGGLLKRPVANRPPPPKPGSSGGPGAGKPFPKKVQDAARQESGDRCVFCGDKTIRSPKPHPKRSNIDHANPKSRGGNNTQGNAQNTCQTCNLDKGARTTQEYLDLLNSRGGGG